jgi:hypothetical protein
MIDNRTQHLDLPLPDVNNQLEDDVVRLQESFNAIDTHAQSTDSSIESINEELNELGNASSKTVTASPLDQSAGKLLQTGDGGLMGSAIDGFANVTIDGNVRNALPGIILSFSGTEIECTAANLPSLGGADTTSRTWIVKSSGSPLLLLIEAVEILGLTGGAGRSFSSVKQDASWSPWIESFNGSNKPLIVDVIGLTGRLDEIETYALAGL